MADTFSLSLTDVLSVPDQQWASVNEVRLKPDLSLPDMKLSDFRETLSPQCEPEAADSSRITSAVRELAHRGSASADGWTPSDILALVATMPAWADYSIKLIPEWSERGASQRLELIDIPRTGAAVEDRRCIPLNDDLREIRQKLASAQSIVEIGQLLSPQTHVIPGYERSTQPASLGEAVLKWVSSGVKSLSQAEMTLLEQDPSSTLNVLADRRQKIPSSRRLDEIALSLLEKCGGADHSLLARVFPVDDEAVSLYVSRCPNSAVLAAAVQLNSNPTRSIDLVLPRDIASAVMNHLVESSKDDAEIYEGLVRSVTISSMRSGSFVRRLFVNEGVDFEYLYSRILPDASGGQTDSLLSLACINPEAFVYWIGVPRPYAAALAEALRHETRQAIWDRISGFFGRWKGAVPKLGGR